MSFGFDGGSSPGNPGGNRPGVLRKGGGGGGRGGRCASPVAAHVAISTRENIA